MIWIILDWNTRECWINTIPKDSAHSGRVLKFDKIYYGNKYIEVRSNESNSIIKIPTQQCIIEEENINRKMSVYCEYE